MPSKLVRRYKRKKRRNPDDAPASSSSSGGLIALGEIGEYVIPGFAGFATARLGTRIAAVQIGKRRPTWGKHAGAAAAVLAFVAAWTLAHRVKVLKKYQLPLVIGSGLAAIQSLIQLYMPGLGWMVSDASTELDAGTQVQQVTAGAAASQLPAGLSPVNDDPSNFVYSDAYDAGRMDSQQQAADQQAANTSGTVDESMFDDLDEQQNMGIFG